jgi:ribulose-5-phosphate 4-epimerase/fuculose-1-phosphate aldolase
MTISRQETLTEKDIHFREQFGFVPLSFKTAEDERDHRKRMLVAGLHIIAALDMEEGVAGHITARDPEYEDRFWVNPFGKYFGGVEVEDLLLVNHQGEVLEGSGKINPAGYEIHSAVHRARPDAISCAHTHSVHGMALSSLRTKLLPLTQTAAAFFEDHGLLAEYPTEDVGRRVAEALGPYKAVILAHHGLLTVGRSVESCVWWFTSMERQARVQLLAAAAGGGHSLPVEIAQKISKGTGSEPIAIMSFQAMVQRFNADTSSRVRGAPSPL